MIMDKQRVLVLDTRPASLFSASHIRGSVCVALHGRTLTRMAGPGPPAWSPNCWWDRHVLLVSAPTSRKRKAREGNDPTSTSHVVFTFLQEEGLVRSIQLLEAEKGEDDAFISFASAYPFLITRSTKAAEIDNYPTEIIPGFLFLGDLAHATSQNHLENLHISHVVSIHTEPLTLPNSFVHIFFDLEDAPFADIAQYFEPMYEFVERARAAQKRVLIHCGAGASRSATLCAAYLMRIKRWGVEDTLKFLKEQRSKVNPNSGFLAALHKYSHSWGIDSVGTKSESATASDSNTYWHLDVIKQGSCIGNLPLNLNSISFGRAADCNVTLDHSSISRQHASLVRGENGEFHLVDNHSTHGTYINGKILSWKASKCVKPGDILQFGASTRSYILCNKSSCCTSF